MKKIGVLFLTLMSVAAIALTSVSCNSAINEELGTVVLDFGGSERDLDANSLPILSTVRIRAEVIGSGGTAVKDFDPGREGTISLSLPVGDTVVIKLSAYNPSGIWSGSVTHTVEPGVNAVSVKLDKKVSGLNKLLFTQTKSGTAVPVYSLTLYVGEEEVELNGAVHPYIFSRDSKGRVYVVYNVGNHQLFRYTSEGQDAENVSHISFIANDYTTGKMYGLHNGLQEIKEDLSCDAISGHPPISEPFAVDNGRVIHGVWGQQILALSKVGSTNVNEIHSDKIDPYARRFGIDTREWMIKDLFIRGDYLYILLAGIKRDSNPDNINVYSLGAVLKWKLGEKTVPAPAGSSVFPDLVGEPVLIGKMPVPPLYDHVIPSSYYKDNFYGAVKVIGFDDENIYIADDGFDAERDGPEGQSHFELTDRNRIAALNIETNELSFTDTDAGWYEEYEN